MLFVQLPKVELHAHLSGSISRSSLQRIWEMQDSDVVSPAIALADETVGQSIGAFFQHFNSYIYHLISTPEALQLATRAVLQDFEADGVVYLELRTTPRALTGLTAEDTIRLVLDEICGYTSERMVTKLILTVDRAKHSPSQAMEIVRLAIRLRDEGLPVVGVDLAGDPNAPSDLPALRPAFLHARDGGLPITVHFAEVPASSTSAELAELLSWHPRRLGHAIHIPDPLRHDIVKRGIAVELCLTCNILAGMLPSPNIVDHHFGWWYKQDCSLSLGTDDVGVFGSPSSQEYRLAAENFQLDEEDLVQICRRASEGIFGGRQDKERIQRLLDDYMHRV